MTELSEFLDIVKAYWQFRRPFLYYIASNVRIITDRLERADRAVRVGHFSLTIDPDRFMALSEADRARALESAIYAILQRLPKRIEYYDGNPEKFTQAGAISYLRDWGRGPKAEAARNYLEWRFRSKWADVSVEEIARSLEEGAVSESLRVALWFAQACELRPEESESASSGAEQERGQGQEGKGEGSGSVLQEGNKDVLEAASRSYDDFVDRLRELVVQAALYSRLAGTSDPIAERILEQLRRPKKWSELLKVAMQEGLGTKFLMSYQRLNRKLPELPGLKMWMKTIAVAVDVSGSISDSEYAEFISAVAGVMTRAKVTFVAWDTRAEVVGRPRSLKELVSLARQVRGYGGTQPDCLVPVLRKLKPKVTVIFTDGCWGKWIELARWARGRYVIVVTTDSVGPWAPYFWRVIRVGGEAR